MIVSLLLVALSAGCYNAGVVLQASAARRSDPETALRPSLLLRLVRVRNFLVGTGLDAAGWIFQVLALTKASLTFVQPALGMGVFLLLGFAWFGLGERPRTGEVIGACGLAAGIALIALGAPPQGRTIDWTRATFAIVALTIVALVPYALRMKRRPVALALSTGAAFAITGLTTVIVSRGVEQRHLYLIGAGLALSIAFGLLGFLAQTSALVSGRVTSVVPVVMVVDTVIPVALAPFVFAERWPSTAGRITELIAGLVCAVFGAAALARSPVVARVRERASSG